MDTQNYKLLVVILFTEQEEGTTEQTRDDDEAMKMAWLWGKLRHWAG